MPLLGEYDSQAPSPIQSKCNMCSKDAISKMNHHQNYIYIYIDHRVLNATRSRIHTRAHYKLATKTFERRWGVKCQKFREKIRLR